MVQLTKNASEQSYTTRNAEHSTETGLSRSLGADQLAYMADMIGELDKLAREGGLETLSGLLALAQVEARRHMGTASGSM
jgi:hypothetical protein